MADREALLRWCAAGILEISTPDHREMLFVDAWFWSSDGWRRFGVEKPPEYASRQGFVDYVLAKGPERVLVALTHDHPDHITDYFEALAALVEAGVEVRSVAQTDLVMYSLAPRYAEAGVDRARVVAYDGKGINIGGTASFGDMTVWMVPAVHSTTSGHPAVGYVVEVGGVRFWCSGDTDVFGDMALVGERYRPDVSVVCISNGRVTMGPEGAVRAAGMVGAEQVVPVHYAHVDEVRQPDAGPEFAELLAAAHPSFQAHVIDPGETLRFSFG